MARCSCIAAVVPDSLGKLFERKNRKNDMYLSLVAMNIHGEFFSSASVLERVYGSALFCSSLTKQKDKRCIYFNLGTSWVSFARLLRVSTSWMTWLCAYWRVRMTIQGAQPVHYHWPTQRMCLLSIASISTTEIMWVEPYIDVYFNWILLN